MKKFICFALLAFLICNLVYAEDSVYQKMHAFKHNLHKYFVSAPKLSIYQKGLLMGICKVHHASISSDMLKARSLILEKNRKIRQLLTRKQLLIIFDAKDEFAMLPHGIKMAIFLKKFPAKERVEMLKLARKLWRGKKSEILPNVKEMAKYLQEKIAPKIVKKLALTQEQLTACKQIHAEYAPKIQNAIANVLEKVFNLRYLARKVLTQDQKDYIEANREKVFQEVVEFVENL